MLDQPGIHKTLSQKAKQSKSNMSNTNQTKSYFHMENGK